MLLQLPCSKALSTHESKLYWMWWMLKKKFCLRFYYKIAKIQIWGLWITAIKCKARKQRLSQKEPPLPPPCTYTKKERQLNKWKESNLLSWNIVPPVYFSLSSKPSASGSWGGDDAQELAAESVPELCAGEPATEWCVGETAVDICGVNAAAWLRDMWSKAPS